MTNAIIWVHVDNLNPNSDVFQKYEGTPAVFVFDEQTLEREQTGLKQILFIYECLLEIPVEIYKGSLEHAIIDFATAHGANEIITSASMTPYYQQTVQHLRQTGLTVKEIRSKTYREYDESLKSPRFLHDDRMPKSRLLN